ncbi:MAG: UvrD-helicase domain-containing protein, partial [Candidatus Halalkalibacterium sp. M3_1C_030]
MQELRAFEADLSGINLIEASAGTGKTYNITSLYVRALVELNLKVKDILVVTYTEAATKELRERLMTRLRESVQALELEATGGDEFLQNLNERVADREEAIAKLRDAIRSFDEAAIYTIHGFCYQALQEQAFESRAMFDAELIGNDKEIVRELIDDYWRVWVKKTSGDESKQPLLKYLMDLGYNPDSLTDELSRFIGKPYLEVQPEEFSLNKVEKNLTLLNDLFKQLKEEWETSRDEIFNKLNAGHLSNYRTGWLEGWMLKMESWLNSKVAPIDLFDKFEKFTQSVINSSLKKASAQKGIAPPEHTFFSLADKYKPIAESLSKYDIKFRLELYTYLRNTLDDRKEDLQQLSYDDLLIRLRNALMDSERGNRLSRSLNKAYPIALVDEFQDTDPIQYQIFKSIYKNSQDDSALFMIGDPKQSIYSFRGADIFSYLEAKKDAPKSRTYSLDRNFRSTPELIDAINVLFSYQHNPFLLDDIPFNPVKAGKDKDKYKRFKLNGELSSPIEIRELHNNSDDFPISKGTAQERSAEDTASLIENLLRKSKDGMAAIGEGNLRAADIAVLVRSHYQAGLMRESLRNKGIKSVQYSQDSVFKSEEAEELHYILKAVAEPAEEEFVKTALATKTMGYTAEDLLMYEHNDSAWVDKLEQFSKWHSAWQENGFAYMFRIMLNDENIPQKIIKRSDGERKLTNLIHLSELIQSEELAGRTGSRSLLQWLARKMKEDEKDR